MTPGPFPDFWVGPGDEVTLTQVPSQEDGEEPGYVAIRVLKTFYFWKKEDQH